MSVLSNTEVIPMCLIGVVRYLTRIAPAGEELETLDGLMTHSGLRGKDDNEPEGGMRKRVVDTCNEFVRLGLLANDAGKLSLSPSLPAASQDRATAEALLPITVTDALLRQNNDDQSFGLALAWYLSLDPLTAPGNWDELAKAESRPEDAPERRLSEMAKSLDIRNDTRFGQFRHWSVYLGFAWAHSLQGSVRIVPDPTSHVRWRLPEIFSAESRLELPTFLRRLSTICPVFEGGELRDAAPKLKAETPGTLSRSTSIALLRLQDQGLIALEARRADSDRVLLDISGELKPFTHISHREPESSEAR